MRDSPPFRLVEPDGRVVLEADDVSMLTGNGRLVDRRHDQQATWFMRWHRARGKSPLDIPYRGQLLWGSRVLSHVSGLYLATEWKLVERTRPRQPPIRLRRYSMKSRRFLGYEQIFPLRNDGTVYVGYADPRDPMEAVA